MSYKTGIINHLINNKIEIHFTDPSNIPTITEDNIVSESMKLKQSICDSDELRFGGCIASQFSIDLLNTSERQFSSQLEGMWIAVKIIQTYADPNVLVCPSSSLHPSDSLYPGRKVQDKEFWIFSGYIDSAKVNKTDKSVITLTAYDAFAKLHETDATDVLYGKYISDFIFSDIWSMCLTNNGVVSIPYNSDIGTFYDGWRAYYNLRNNDWCNRKDKISFGQLLRCACEMIGAFGFIEPDNNKGTFTLKKLAGNIEEYEFYESLNTEDYESTGYTDFKFTVYSGNDPGDVAKPGKNVTAGGLSDFPITNVSKCYDFTQNILIWVKYAFSDGSRTTSLFDKFINGDDMQGYQIGNRLAMNSNSNECKWDKFQPLSATLDGRLWVNVGQPITILVNRTDPDGSFVLDDETGDIIKDEVNTYVLSRTLTGIQALTDNIEVKGAP